MKFINTTLEKEAIVIEGGELIMKSTVFSDINSTKYLLQANAESIINLNQVSFLRTHCPLIYVKNSNITVQNLTISQ